MKLHHSPTSPFVRKVVVAAHERGLAERIELASPAGPGELLSDNPLEKVPTLVLDDGRVLFDSLVIVVWLDGRGSGPDLVPSDPGLRVDVLRRHALADGIMEASVASVMESRRPGDRVWDDFLLRQRGKIERGIDALEREVPAMDGVVDLSSIAAGAALGYVDFRLAALDWRSGHPDLAAWFETFSRRPSMVGTRPQDPPAG